MDKYPNLQDFQKERLLRAMQQQIAKKPARHRFGFWSVTFPQSAEARLNPAAVQREYVADVARNGVLTVRTLDGDFVVHGPLGWIWGTPAFRKDREQQEFAAKDGA